MKLIKKISVAVTSMVATLVLCGTVSAMSASDAPLGIKQTADTANSVTLDWSDTESITQYAVWVSSSKDAWTEDTFVKGGYVNGSNCIVDGLVAGRSYYVKIANTVVGDDNQRYMGAWSEPMEVVTKPEDLTFAGNSTLKQTGAKKNQITVSWPAVAGANGYEVRIAKDNSETNLKKLADVKTTSVIISTNTSTYVEVGFFRKASTGYVAKCARSQIAYKYSCKPTPGKVKKVKLIGDSGNGLSVKYSKVKNCDGYEIQYCKYNGKSKKHGFSTSTKCSIPKLNKHTFYKVRVRACVVLSGKKYASGKWSKYIVCCMDQTTHGATAENSAIHANKPRLKWKKTKGATSYTVYMSTKKSGKYKKVATVKKNSIVLSQFNGSGFAFYKNYYWYVVANRKVGKKTYKSVSKGRRSFDFIKKYY